MKLAKLLTVDAVSDARFADLDVRAIAADSRKVEAKSLFVAVTGTKDDGLRFVQSAIDAGAVAIMAEKVPPVPLPDGVAFVRVGNARRALAIAASRLFKHQPDTIAAVTGTSGKTSVAAFTRQIWEATGEVAASIGTIGLVAPGREIYGSLTTPDPVALHRTLDELAGDDVTHLVLEASSHGLDQFRLDGVRITAGAFTNLSRDHLDYHPTLEAYLAAKLRLFSELVHPRGAAVIVADHDHADKVIAAAKQRRLRLLTVGRRGEGIRLNDSTIDGFAQVLKLTYAGTDYTVRLPLVGDFQVENALTAAGLAIATDSEPRAVFAALETLKGAKGRLDLAGERDGAPIFVDYAHKPDALAKALEALRPYASRQLVVVFGCGGDRDAGKRPMMGAIAAEKADRVIVTDDNPRSEQPADIRAAILKSAPGADRNRRPRRGDRPQHRRPAPGRRAADRRQGPRNRPDCRQPDSAIQRPRGGRGRAAGEIGMSSAPLWTVEAMAQAMGATRAARCRPRSPAFPSTAAASAAARPSSRSRAMPATAMTSSRPRSPTAPALRSSPPTSAMRFRTTRRCSSCRTCSTACATSPAPRASVRKAPSSRVTGSVGKTSTKDALRLALAPSGETHASVASYNNHWGVPLSLARCPASARFAVFEMGMNHAGEIEPLSRLVRPHVAIVTTIAPVHLEYLRLDRSDRRRQGGNLPRRSCPAARR